MLQNISFDCYAVSDKGLRRRLNEDAYICNPDTGLFLVADGIGGENCGEVASQLTATTFENYMTPFLVDEDATIPFEQPSEADPFLIAMTHALEQTNKTVLKFAKENPSHRGMGTTLTTAVVHGKESLYIAHVGDSRLYRFQNGTPVQITEDHTRVQEMVKKNLISTEEARTHQDRHIITQCIGRKKRLKPDVFRIETSPGILYMLCTDGLYDMIDEEEIRKVIVNQDLNAAGEKLIARANANGGKDNITVVLFQQH